MEFCGILWNPMESQGILWIYHDISWYMYIDYTNIPWKKFCWICRETFHNFWNSPRRHGKRQPGTECLRSQQNWQNKSQRNMMKQYETCICLYKYKGFFQGLSTSLNINLFFGGGVSVWIWRSDVAMFFLVILQTEASKRLHQNFGKWSQEKGIGIPSQVRFMSKVTPPVTSNKNPVTSCTWLEGRRSEAGRTFGQPSVRQSKPAIYDDHIIM